MRHTDKGEELSHTYSCLESFEAFGGVHSSQALLLLSANQSHWFINKLIRINLLSKNITSFAQMAESFLHLTEMIKVIIARH